MTEPHLDDDEMLRRLQANGYDLDLRDAGGRWVAAVLRDGARIGAAEVYEGDTRRDAVAAAYAAYEEQGALPKRP